jgi:hypothetical protein
MVHLMSTCAGHVEEGEIMVASYASIRGIVPLGAGLPDISRCPHGDALAIPFVHDPRLLRVVNGQQAKDVHDRTDVPASLDSIILETS